MRPKQLHTRILCLWVICCLCGALAMAQTQKPEQGEDVIRVETALVQTDVMVFDKGGSFVSGLKRDQFVLKVDGKPREISSFEQINAGSRSEEAQIAAARGSVNRSTSAAPVPLDRGRTVFFFIDDLHLSISSIRYAQNLLLRFIDHDLGQNDQAAIASSSGQIGFLQQLTDNRAVLRAAVNRIKYRDHRSLDLERPHMSEYQALLIDRGDIDVIDYFVDELLKENPGLPRATAEDMVKNRASQILQYAGFLNTNMFATLESYVRNSAQLAGRKIVFFVSDGFLLDPRNSDSLDRLRRVTAAAAASGVVIYSIDARGLIASLDDPSSPAPADPTGRLQRATGGEIHETQDGMNALARDTGGRPFFNTNALSPAVHTALKESSVYYLLAWRPETEEQRSAKFRRLEVSVIGHPELTVRFRSGYGAAELADNAARKKDKKPDEAKPSNDELRAALRSAYPKTTLPVSASLNFVNLPDRGSVLATSLKVRTTDLIFDTNATPAIVDLAGIVFDDQGKTVDIFSQRVTIKPKQTAVKVAPPESVVLNHFSSVKPGLYQVRVAAREDKQRQTGSSWQWIEVPDLTDKALTLSSLIVGERKQGQTAPASPSMIGEAGPLSQVILNVDHVFASTSHLRFLTFVYNAMGSAAAAVTGNSVNIPASTAAVVNVAPDLAVQVQVFRDNEPVITDPLHRINLEGVTDLMRIPFAAELDLGGLQAGNYVLQVTVIDRIAKRSTSQRFKFRIN